MNCLICMSSNCFPKVDGRCGHRFCDIVKIDPAWAVSLVADIIIEARCIPPKPQRDDLKEEGSTYMKNIKYSFVQ